MLESAGLDAFLPFPGQGGISGCCLQLSGAFLGQGLSPLAKGREGCPEGLEKGCLEDRLSPRVSNLAGEV